MFSWTRTDRSAFPWYLTRTEGPNPGPRRTHSRPARVPSLGQEQRAMCWHGTASRRERDCFH